MLSASLIYKRKERLIVCFGSIRHHKVMYRILMIISDSDRWKNFQRWIEGGGWSSLKLTAKSCKSLCKFIVDESHDILFSSILLTQTQMDCNPGLEFSSRSSGGNSGTYHTKDKKTVCWELEAQVSASSKLYMWDDLLPQFLLWNDRIWLHV